MLLQALALEGFGKLLKSLRGLWEALGNSGGLWEALGPFGSFGTLRQALEGFGMF